VLCVRCIRVWVPACAVCVGVRVRGCTCPCLCPRTRSAQVCPVRGGHRESPLQPSLAQVHALRAKTIRAAALDVTDPEPLPRDHPLLSMDEVVISPHVGTATLTTRARMVRMALENLAGGLAGGVMPYELREA
jgi:hypothetical protein